MTVVQMNAEILRELSIIVEDDDLMSKTLKYLKRLTASKRAEENMRPKEELEEIVRQGDEEIKNGSFTVMAIDDIWK